MGSSLACLRGGLLLTGYIGDAVLGIGEQFMLTSVAAVVIGGTALTRRCRQHRRNRSAARSS